MPELKSVIVLEGLDMPLAERELEGHAEAVPRIPRAPAPLVALMLRVPHSLTEVEVVGDVECDPEAEKLVLAE